MNAKYTMINKATFIGKVTSNPKLYYTKKDINYYLFELTCLRNSGTPDVIAVVITENKLTNVSMDQFIKVTGELRSRNQVSPDDVRLKVFTYAYSVDVIDLQNELEPQEQVNEVVISGYVCKKPLVRKTYLSQKTITNLFIAVNDDKLSKSYYIPCIVWGSLAYYVGDNVSISNYINLKGRLQSRYYKKIVNGEQISLMINELSVNSIEINGVVINKELIKSNAVDAKVNEE